MNGEILHVFGATVRSGVGCKQTTRETLSRGVGVVYFCFFLRGTRLLFSSDQHRDVPSIDPSTLLLFTHRHTHAPLLAFCSLYSSTVFTIPVILFPTRHTDQQAPPFHVSNMFTQALTTFAFVAALSNAIKVESPSKDTVWSSSTNSQTVSWEAVSTDATSFAILLVNQVCFSPSPSLACSMLLILRPDSWTTLPSRWYRTKLPDQPTKSAL